MIPVLSAPDWVPVLDALSGPGWGVLPQAIPPDLLTALRDELRAEDAAGGFHAACIGRGSGQQVETRIRGDRIAWLAPAWPAAARYLALMDDLRQVLNRELFLGLADYEAHYARYAPGSFYRRHVDRHLDPSARGRGQRVISTVCYLNEPDWPAQAGGELMLYPQDAAPQRVLPEAGTLVVFRSDNLPHEVLTADRERLSIAGWMRTRD